MKLQNHTTLYIWSIWNRGIRTCLLVIMFATVMVLQGCGGGSAPPPILDADPTGYYTNTGTADVLMDDDTTPRPITDLQGMVVNGELMLLSVSENIAFVGTFTVSGNDYSGTVTVYESGIGTQMDVPVSGTITEGTSITGNMTGSGVANGDFTLNYAPPADNGQVDVATVIHDLDWLPVNNNEYFDLSIANDPVPIPNIGGTTGSSGFFRGCGFNGRLEPISGTHLYSVSGTMKNCRDNPEILIIPTYTGLASVRGNDPDDRFILVLTNGDYGINSEYIRQLPLL